jgi:RND family efflux transporter MFP subunit
MSKHSKHNAIQRLLFPALILVIWNMPFAVASNHTTGLETGIAQVETVSREFRLDGVVEAVNQTTVSAQTQGTVQSVLVDVDDFVEKGAMIVRLNDKAQQAEYKKASAGVKEAESHLRNAEDAYKRTSEVYEKKAVSKSKLDEAKNQLDAARARLESAKASLETAEERLSYTRVTAPYSGFVTRRNVEVGESVQPGAALMTGVSLEQLRVNVDVPQSLISKIRQYGQAFVYVDTADGERAVTVEKITVFPIADHASNTFKVRLDLPDGTEGLFPGMYVKTSLVTGEKQELVVPDACVVRRSEVTAVYVLSESGEIHFRHVRLGNRVAGNKQVVLSGLEDGETVALDPIKAGVALIEQRKHASAPAGAGHD